MMSISSEHISKMIATEKLRLTPWSWFSHYWPVIFALAVPAFAIYTGITMLLGTYKGVRSFQETISISYFFIPLAAIFFVVQNKRLRFKIIKTNLTYEEIEEAIDSAAQQSEWELRERNNNFIQAFHCGSFLTGSLGEQITLIILENRVLVNSICDPEKISSMASFGQNAKHIKSLVDNLTLIEKRKSNE